MKQHKEEEIEDTRCDTHDGVASKAYFDGPLFGIQLIQLARGRMGELLHVLFAAKNRKHARLCNAANNFKLKSVHRGGIRSHVIVVVARGRCWATSQAAAAAGWPEPGRPSSTRTSCCL